MDLQLDQQALLEAIAKTLISVCAESESQQKVSPQAILDHVLSHRSAEMPEGEAQRSLGDPIESAEAPERGEPSDTPSIENVDGQNPLSFDGTYREEPPKADSHKEDSHKDDSSKEDSYKEDSSNEKETKIKKPSRQVPQVHVVPELKDTWLTPLVAEQYHALREKFNMTNFAGRVTVFEWLLSATTPKMDSTSAFAQRLAEAGETVTFTKFIDLILQWAHENAFEYTVRKSIADFERVLPDLAVPADQAKAKSVLRVLRQQLKPLPEITFQQPNLEKTLSNIFAYYAKSQRLVGNNPSFDEISQNNSTLTLGKFLKFALEYSIQGKLMSRQELIKLFKRYASYTRNMNFNEFLVAMDIIAEKCTNGNSDKTEKETQLAKFLGLKPVPVKRRSPKVSLKPVQERAQLRSNLPAKVSMAKSLALNSDTYASRQRLRYSMYQHTSKRPGHSDHVLSLGDLNKLDPQELGEEEFLEGLVSDKHKTSAGRIKSLAKLHDAKMQLGLNLIAKYKSQAKL